MGEALQQRADAGEKKCKQEAEKQITQALLQDLALLTRHAIVRNHGVTATAVSAP
jgi:hypothetical protein